MFENVQQTELIEEVYIKLTCPQIPYDDFHELIEHCPECSVDYIGTGEYVPYRCMNRSDWEIWMRTGVMPQVMGIV